MVLGMNGLAFVASGGTVTALNLTNGTPSWNYPNPHLASIVAATGDGGLIVNDSVQGLITLDANGSPGPATPAPANAQPWTSGYWLGVYDTLPGMSGGPLASISMNTWPFTDGAATRQRQSQRPTFRTFLPVSPLDEYSTDARQWGTLENFMRNTVSQTSANNTFEEGMWEKYQQAMAIKPGCCHDPRDVFINSTVRRPAFGIAFIGHSVFNYFPVGPNGTEVYRGRLMRFDGYADTDIYPEGVAPNSNPDDPELNFTDYYDPDTGHTVNLFTPPPNGWNYVTPVPSLTTNASVLFVAGCYSGKHSVNWGFPTDLNTTVSGKALVVQNANNGPSSPGAYVNLYHAYRAWVDIEEQMVLYDKTVQEAVNNANQYMAQEGYSETWTVVGDGTVCIQSPCK